MAMNRYTLRQGFLLFSLLLLIGGWIYRANQEKALQSRQLERQKILDEIQTIQRLKKLWGTKGLSSRIDRIKNGLPATKVKRFEKKRGRLRIHVADLEGRRLNQLLRELGNLPLRFDTLTIHRQGRLYEMECTCKW
jgi:hypothetical protein